MPVEPFIASLLGGLLGGIATGATVIIILRAKGQQWFIDPQVDYLEKRLKEVVVEQAFAQVGKMLDKGERIGQVASRVLEVVQLVRGGKLPDFVTNLAGNAPAATSGNQGLAAAHAAMAIAMLGLKRDGDARREFEQALRLDSANLAALQGLRGLDEAAKLAPVIAT